MKRSCSVVNGFANRQSVCRSLLLTLFCIAAAGCSTTPSNSTPLANASSSFAEAINRKNIDAAMAHWSEDALLYVQSGNEATDVVSRAAIRSNYEHMFEDARAPRLSIRVDGMEVVGSTAHEWGTFEIGDSTGCYVLVRRAVDDWKIYREWIVEPCGHAEPTRISAHTDTGLHYIIEGTGPPVVFVHGFSQTHRMWFRTALYNDLKDSHTLIAVDLPGHGDSDKSHNPEAYGRNIEQRLVELLDHLHIRAAHFVGFSMGANIVGGLLASHSERIRTAALASGLFTTWNPVEEQFARQTEQRAESDERYPWEPENQDFKALAAVIRGTRHAVLTEGEIERIETPTIAAFGSLEGGHVGNRLTRLPSSIATLIIEGADHDSDKAAVLSEEFSRAVQKLIESHTAGSSGPSS